MVFGKSITYDENGLGDAAHAAGYDSVFGSVENEFLERLRNGEADAFDSLIQRYSGDIYYCLVMKTEGI